MRSILDFDKGWFFHKGEIENPFPSYKGYAYITAKTERAHKGPACKDYVVEVDSYNLNKEHKIETWESVNLPHDYVIAGLPEEKYNNALGFVPYENAWYIKKFKIEEEDKNKRICLFFEGVATHATVWVNGCLMKHNFCGYTSFEVDITDVVKIVETNTVSVYVNTQNHEGWWYEGGGIYRHVKLIKTDKISVDLWGIYAKPKLVEGNKWRVETKTAIRNDNDKRKSVTIEGNILDEKGNVIAVSSVSGMINGKEKREFTYLFEVENPALYSPDSPTRYTMRAKVFTGKTQTDTDEVKFGFRTFYLDPNKGMFINGKHYKIQGVCGHADCGLTGKAVPDNLHRYKVKLMKEMGANGYRTSHYPQSEALMEELDKNGFIVMDETRWFESTDEGKAQLEMMMKRDRNRACVYFWSMGNEEPLHATDEGARIMKSLYSFARKLDDTRAIMTAVSYSPEKASVYEDVDVLGINYTWEAYETLHKAYPNKAIFSSECCASGTTRGWYYDDDIKRGYVSAYDDSKATYFMGRELTWKFIMQREWILGGYQWIAFEHRGEAVWPRVCSQSGAIDLFLQKKDAFYQNKSYWTKEPMIHLLPHWNFEGLEGRKIKVWAYTNAPKAELFLNGKRLGLREIEPYGHGAWEVPYEKGVLKVVAYDVNNNVIATDEYKTTGKPYALKLTLNTKDVQANGKDIAVFTCSVVDEDGLEVPDAGVTVDFTTNGAGSVYSTGSDVSDHTSLFLPTRRMRAGKISVAVKMNESDEPLTLIAESDGLHKAIITVNGK